MTTAGASPRIMVGASPSRVPLSLTLFRGCRGRSRPAGVWGVPRISLFSSLAAAGAENGREKSAVQPRQVSQRRQLSQLSQKGSGRESRVRGTMKAAGVLVPCQCLHLTPMGATTRVPTLHRTRPYNSRNHFLRENSHLLLFIHQQSTRPATRTSTDESGTSMVECHLVNNLI